MIEGPGPEEDDDPWADEGTPRRRGLRVVLVRSTAVVLIIALLLAFPLGYLLQTLVQHHRPDATLFVVEAVAFVVIWAAIRVSRRF
ncbi:MAG TPA: hypothetical protein VG245_07420 [Candidatus Dormibacteraeota bacterium]|nr:hypothetical protein [Candidatus Dormibacteraeota bacterium]